MRGERLHRHQFDAATESELQEFTQREEMVECFLAGQKFDQDIDVAVAARLIPLYGPEQSQALHSQPENF